MSRYEIEPLGEAHPRDDFLSGDAALDLYFRERVTQDVKRRVAGCYVATESGRVAGFYTLAAASLPLADLPDSLARKLPRYPVVPAMLLGRLAVHADHQGQGLGRALVFDACLRTSRLGVGAYAMLVKPKSPAAARFYASTGFLELSGPSALMFVPLATVLKL